MTSAALGLSARDFDAYLPDRASSNVFSRPRLEFKQRALSWARGVVARLRNLGIHADLHASDDHPSLWNRHRVDCQWVFFWRDAEQRADLDALLDQRRGIVDTLRDPSPYLRHAFLALRVDSVAVEVCVQVHPDAWLDFETLRARLVNDTRADSVAGAISGLPDEFSFGVGASRQPCSGATASGLRGLVEESAARSEALWIGWRIEREVAVEHSALLDDQLQDAIVALAAAYSELSWSRDDDAAQLAGKVDQMRQDALRTATDRAAEDAKRKVETEQQRLQTSEKSRERTRERVDYAARPNISLANLFKSESVSPAQSHPTPPPPKRPRSVQPEAVPQELPVQREAKPRPARQEAPKPQPIQNDEPPREPRDAVVELVEDPTATLEKGASVRVNAGPFAGKVGVIGELDGRGSARVLLGLLSTKLLVSDLAALIEAKDRPSLQSSSRWRP